MFQFAREVEKFCRITSEKNVTLGWFVNSDMVKPEKNDDFNLLCHFAIPLRHFNFSNWPFSVTGEFGFPYMWKEIMFDG